MEYRFHCSGIDHASVVCFRLEDTLSQPYELQVLLHQRDGEPPILADLLGLRATLRIATGIQPTVRSVHGIVIGARDVGTTPDGYLYELQIGPPLVRAMHRHRSRIFHEKTIRQVIEAVLLDGYVEPRAGSADDDSVQMNDPFAVSSGQLAWSVRDVSRIDDPKARPYCVQYEESDFAFVSRLLEHEGIAYHFEHNGSAVTMVLADHDGGRPHLSSALGRDVLGRHIEGVQIGHRMRPGKVTMTSYSWERPEQNMRTQDMLAERGGSDELFVATMGAYTLPRAHGDPLARGMLERLRADARLATVHGSCRLLGAGIVFALEHEREAVAGEYLATKVEIRGRADGELPPGVSLTGTSAAVHAQHKPFTMQAECMRRGVGNAVEESRYRPPCRTPKPQIVGLQTAIVTDDPNARGAEIHVGGPDGNENGCVRVRFHWDTETDRHEHEPTSCWVRVSQTSAGAGGGAVWHPRVGTEVIVEHLNGDPEQPIVTGRLYNGVQKPPLPGKGAATVSGFHSQSSPGGETHNAFTFDDTAGKEQVNLHAGRDWNSTCGSDRSEEIGNNSTSDVTADRTEKTGGNRQTEVSGNNCEEVSGDDELCVSGSQTWSVSGPQTHTISAERSLSVGGSHTVCTGPETYTVKGTQALNVTAGQNINVVGSCTLAVGASMNTTVGATYALNAPVVAVNAPVHTMNAVTATVNAAGVLNLLAGAAANVQGAVVSVTAAGELVLSGGGSAIRVSGAGIEITGGAIKIAGGSVDITGGVVKVN